MYPDNEVVATSISQMRPARLQVGFAAFVATEGGSESPTPGRAGGLIL
jgi:hypothetical protein